MNASPLTITGPADLVEAVPYLLGFTPTDSLVIVGLAANTTARSLPLATPSWARTTAQTGAKPTRRPSASGWRWAVTRSAMPHGWPSKTAVSTGALRAPSAHAARGAPSAGPVLVRLEDLAARRRRVGLHRHQPGPGRRPRLQRGSPSAGSNHRRDRPSAHAAVGAAQLSGPKLKP